MPKPQQPESAILLLVEGNDQRNFFGELVEHLKIEDLQIQISVAWTSSRAFLA